MLRQRVPALRSIALVSSLSMITSVGVSSVAVAGPAPKADAPAETESAPAADPLAEAQTLYNRGRGSFDTADYATAIKLWTEAYTIVPDTPDGNQIKVLLIYNIATAREKAFDVNQDPAELRQAKILLGNFEKKITTLYGEGAEAEAERQKVLERIAAIDELLAAYEKEHQTEPDPDQTPPPEVEPPPEQPPERTGPDPTTRGLIIGGAVSAGLGVVSLGVMAAGLGMGARANDISGLQPDDIDGRRAQFDRGRLGNALGFVGAASGVFFLVSGAVLLGIGFKRKNRSETTARVVPQLSPTHAGLSLQRRF